MQIQDHIVVCCQSQGMELYRQLSTGGDYTRSRGRAKQKRLSEISAWL